MSQKFGNAAFAAIDFHKFLSAGAMDAYGVKLHGGVEMQAFLEAMASGSVKAGINGIQLQGYAGISNGIKITEQQSFSLGGGVQMLQTTDVGY